MSLPTTIEYLGLALTAPREYMRIIVVERRSIAYGFAIVLIMSIMAGVAIGYTIIGKILVYSGIPWLGTLSVIGSTLSMIIGGIALWFILGSLLHLFSIALGGKARFEETLNAYSLAWLPLFLHGFASIGYVFMDYIASILLCLVIEAIAFLWGIVLVVIGCSTIHRITIARSLLALVLTYIVFLALLFSPLLVIIL